MHWMRVFTMFEQQQKRVRMMGTAFLALVAVLEGSQIAAQDTPLISGGVGFITSTNGGNTTYIPVISPLLAAPIGDHLFVESRATILNSYFPKGGGQPGYTSSSFLGLSYLQMDYLATSHLTVVAGEFLTPFGTYNERLTPIWISNFESAPLIFPLGSMGTGSSVGGMVRGSAFSNDNVSLDYAGYFSAESTNEQFNSQRSSGGRASVYLPEARLEIGASYGRLLQNTHQNYEGVDLWWEPADGLVKMRSEYAHGQNSQGYWIEPEFHLTRSDSANLLRRVLLPVFRWQQTFRSSPDPSDGLPAANTNQADFGFDFLFPHEVRINSSYSRQFSSTGDRNIWQTGIVYRFLFPTWRRR
jgi:hypothetical protein